VAVRESESKFTSFYTLNLLGHTFADHVQEGDKVPAHARGQLLRESEIQEHQLKPAANLQPPHIALRYLVKTLAHAANLEHEHPKMSLWVLRYVRDVIVSLNYHNNQSGTL
jgi:hypothetical protein